MEKQHTAIQRRERRIRGKMHGTALRPRLSVYRSSKYVSAQLIDDDARRTLLGVTQKQVAGDTKGTKTDIARQVGVSLAKLAVEKKIKKAVFDRGSYRYHGRVKAFADGAREGGLEF